MLNRVTINTLLKTVIAALGVVVVIMLSLSAWEIVGAAEQREPRLGGYRCFRLLVHGAAQSSL